MLLVGNCDQNTGSHHQSRGLPVWDVGWSYEIYQNALKLGLGQTLKLWDEPYLN